MSIELAIILILVAFISGMIIGWVLHKPEVPKSCFTCKHGPVLDCMSSRCASCLLHDGMLGYQPKYKDTRWYQ